MADNELIFLGAACASISKVAVYLSSYEVSGLAKATRSLYANALKHLVTFLTINQIQDISIFSSSFLSNFAKYLEDGNLSGKSIQQYMTCTKIFLKWAGHPVDYTYKISNQDRQANKKKHLDRWMDEYEIAQCRSYEFARLDINERFMWRAIVGLLIDTGARVGEIAGVKESDIRMDEGTAFIQGKTEPRPVFFSEDTGILLQHHLDTRPIRVFDASEGGDIFPPVNKIKSGISDMLKDLGLKNGSDGRGPHTFRHYTATYLFYVGGMDVTDLAYLLGDKVDTIREKYLHPTPKMLRDRVAKAMGWKI